MTCLIGAIAAMRRRIRGILMTGKQFSLDSRMDLVQGIMSHGGARTASDPTTALPLMKEDSVEGADSG
jgi:histidine decarboxylase